MLMSTETSKTATYTYPAEEEIVFDPKIHLNYVPPTVRFTAEDLLLKSNPGSGPYAGTGPFPFLSAAGVLAYRKALFSPEVLDNCSHLAFSTLILRNVAKHSRFIRDLWEHKETKRIIADAAGVELEPVMPIEIAHTNIQINGDTIEEKAHHLHVEPIARKVCSDAADKVFDPLSESVIPWHHDSFPFVCVLMVSNTDGMVGGETYIRKGDGTALQVANPVMGHAVILNGGEVEHLASRAHGVEERITSITSYCQKKTGIYDSSYIGRVRPLTKSLPDLYSEWVQYRLKKMNSEIQMMQSKINRDGFDIKEFESFAQQQENYLTRTRRHLIAPEVHHAAIQKYSQKGYYDAGSMLKKIRQHPSFTHLASSVSEQNWRTGSVLWMDLARSFNMIRAGQELESQDGRFTWDEGSASSYTLGDELIRQGLYEYFLQWFDVTGLWDLYQNSYPN